MTDKTEELKPCEALAEVWASIDGKLDKFNKGKIDPLFEDINGYYNGYMLESEEALKRLERRGFALVNVLDTRPEPKEAGIGPKHVPWSKKAYELALTNAPFLTILEAAKAHTMSPEEIDEQRESYVRGEMGWPETSFIDKPKEDT